MAEKNSMLFPKKTFSYEKENDQKKEKNKTNKSFQMLISSILHSYLESKIERTIKKI